MEKLIPLPTMKEFIWDEFMEPLHISVKKMADDIFFNIQKDVDMRKAKRMNQKRFNKIKPFPRKKNNIPYSQQQRQKLR